MEEFTLSRICILLASLVVVAEAGVREFVEFPTRVGHLPARTRRELNSCGNGNPIDDCWQCDSDWENNRQALANCVIGFGNNTSGGQNGAIYVVTDSGDNPTDPQPGTLRYAATRSEALWIVFDGDMQIDVQAELQISSFKTIDGRGALVHITNSCITIQEVEQVIIHGLYIHDCVPTGPADDRTDGDGIVVSASTNVWIDHNSFSSCTDGLLDVNLGSDSVSITNNIFSNHDKVMLLGSNDNHLEDLSMHVTVAFNVFGPGLVQRMPRCRLGTFHVVNNYYKLWEMYAIGGSANPTVSSEGNYFEAGDQKLVTKYIDSSGNYRSVGDLFINGAWFEPAGASADSSVYAQTNSFTALPAAEVPDLTASAGPVS